MDPLCSIKYVGVASVYQSYKYASVVILDKFDFNFNEEYCNRPQSIDDTILNNVLKTGNHVVDIRSRSWT